MRSLLDGSRQTRVLKWTAGAGTPATEAQTAVGPGYPLSWGLLLSGEQLRANWRELHVGAGLHSQPLATA